MSEASDTGFERTVAPRTACLSIFAFWAFYFTIITFKSIISYGFDGEFGMIGQRAVVSLISGGATILFWLALRRVFSANLRRNIVTAAILAAPAALIYSSVNYAIFDRHVLTTPITIVRSPSAPPSLSFGTPPSPEEDMTPMQIIVGDAVNGYFFFATWAALFLLLCYGVEVRGLERRAAALRAAAQSAELRALRYQVNPHFLFNTLNSLSSLVLARRNDAAERMIANLADFFRTRMSGYPTADVSLAVLFFLQRLYLEIETARFPERLKVEIDIAEDAERARVPGLILQPLIENAVKHGVARSRRRVTVSIRARCKNGRLHVAVRDDGDGAGAPVESGGGVGLRNVRDRLGARYGDAATLRAERGTQGGYAVTLTLPIERDDG
jgi:two-component sensor histidine kinase